MATMIMRLHKGKISLLGLAVFVIAFATCATFVKPKGSVLIGASANPAYSPQLSRNAEWDGPTGKNKFTDDQIQKIAQNNAYEVIPKFSDQFNIQAHFADARKIAAVASSYNNPIKIFDYFSGSFWFNANNNGWKPYSDTFNTDWYLKDPSGNPIPYYTLGNTVADGKPPIGYMIDNSNPAYRAWAVATITDWMKQAPYKGVAFDSSNVLVGNVSRGNVGDGNTTWNDSLCGANAPVDASGNCAKVAQWNAGLASLLAETKAAIGPMGGEVLYNGVAPSNARGDTRNVGLLSYADIALNESFCYGAAAANPSALTFKSLTDDISMMQQQAAKGKKLFEVSNYQVSDKLQYGSYCLGGFLMGWQPGYSYWIYHRNYGDSLSDQYPMIAEQNLNLGNPTGSYQANGLVLSRTFQNGYVVVNNSDTSVSYTLPSKLVQFSEGKQGSVYTAGSQLTLPARSGAFFLNNSYVNPGAGNSPSTGGGSATTVSDNKDSGANQTDAKTHTSGTIAANGQLAGVVSLETPAIDGVTKVEYYIDGKLVRTVTKFPDSGNIDTSMYSNGEHVLLTKYYHTDGTVTSTIKNITIFNPGLRERVTNVVKKAAIPSLGIVVIVGIVFYIFQRFRFMIPRWFYRHDESSKVVTHAQHAPTSKHLPGAVIKPERHESTGKDETKTDF